MAEAHAKHHDYHLVDPSPWPLIGAISAFVMAVGSVMWMKGLRARRPARRPFVFGAGVLGVLYTMLALVDATSSARPSYEGYHTRVVQLHHRYGMIMFIASEVMFFVAWFWAYFDASLFPATRCSISARDLTGGAWPPEGHRDLRSLAPAAAQHADPADLGHHGHLGASCAAA